MMTKESKPKAAAKREHAYLNVRIPTSVRHAAKVACVDGVTWDQARSPEGASGRWRADTSHHVGGAGEPSRRLAARGGTWRRAQGDSLVLSRSPATPTAYAGWTKVLQLDGRAAPVGAMNGFGLESHDA